MIDIGGWAACHHDPASVCCPGRAAIAKLRLDGTKLSAQLMQMSLQRQARLFKNFTKADTERLRAMLTQLAQNLTGADGDR